MDNIFVPWKSSPIYHHKFSLSYASFFWIDDWQTVSGFEKSDFFSNTVLFVNGIINRLFKLVMGPGQIFLTLVRSGQPFMVWFWIWKISPKNVKFLIFFPCFWIKKNLFGLGQKVPGSKAGWSFIYCGSKVSSGRVRSGPISCSD